jgi:hypothetical protein
MYDWRIVYRTQEHCNDLLREAEQERTARLALGGRPSRGSLYGKALLRLGLRIASLGVRPHLHGGEASKRPELSSAR